MVTPKLNFSVLRTFTNPVLWYAINVNQAIIAIMGIYEGLTVAPIVAVLRVLTTIIKSNIFIDYSHQTIKD